METELERIARLETIVQVIPEMHSDLKELVAWKNQQQGRVAILGLVWTGLIGVAGAFGGHALIGLWKSLFSGK